MRTSFVTALALAVSVSQVAAGHIPRSRHAVRGYKQDADILEDYTGYHVRYLALDCTGKHGSEFFEKCCHPLLRTQNLSERPAECTPSAANYVSAAIAEPTAAPVDNDPIYTDEDCEEDKTTYAAPEPTYAPEPAAAKSPEPSKMVTSTVKPEPAPTPAKEPEPAPTKEAEPSKEPEPTPSGDVNAGGFATWFLQNGNPGACGEYHSDSDLIVAIHESRYGGYGKKSDLCDKKVRITNVNNGKSVTASIKDSCPTCVNANSIDLSQGTFQQIADLGDGMVPITWTWA